MSMVQRPQNGTELASLDGEIVEYQTPAVLGLQIQSEIEAQVGVARKYPRSIKQFRDDAMTLATADKEVAKSCGYSVPRGGKLVTGPSIRLAEIIASCFGNLRVVARILGDDTRFVTAQATCLDVQKNHGETIEVKRRITNKEGKTYNEDMIAMTGAAAVAIARRSAIFAVVPNAFTQIIYREACKVARGDDIGFTDLRNQWISHFVPRKVSLDRVLRALGVASVDDMTVDHVDILIGVDTSITEKELTIDQAFPRLDVQPAPSQGQPGQSKTQRLKEELKAKGASSNPDSEDAGGTAEGQA